MLDTNKEIEISVVGGVEGKCIYLNGLRIASSKPWGGGQVIYETKCELKDILEAIPELKQIVTYLQQPTEH